jgi:predicted DNA-binding protein
MAPQTRKDMRFPQELLDRIESLAEETGEDRNALIRRAATIGVAQLEAELAQHYAYQNSKAVREKLQRRGKAWEEAIALLQSGDVSEGAIAKALELLKRSAGGE